MIKKFCEFCGKEYSVCPGQAKTSKYCSRQCQNTRQARRKRVNKQLKFHFKRESKCKICKKPTSKRRDLCFNCHIKLIDARIIAICKNCGAEISCYKKRKRVFCSEKCQFAFYRGNGNPNYIDGRTPENKRLRASDEYKEWRTKIFQRDNYTCRECGQVGGKLHIDHIFPFSLFPSGRMHPANGRTMCESCHRKTFTFLRKWKSQEQFLNEFYLRNFTDEYEDVTERI